MQQPQSKMERESSVARSVRDCVAETLHIPVDQVVDRATLVQLGADSFQLVDVVCRIEQRLSIRFPIELSSPGQHTIQELIRQAERLRAT